MSSYGYLCLFACAKATRQQRSGARLAARSIDLDAPSVSAIGTPFRLRVIMPVGRQQSRSST
jgi:hypothetical protein